MMNCLNIEMQGAVSRANAVPGVHPYWSVLAAPDFARHGYCVSRQP